METRIKISTNLWSCGYCYKVQIKRFMFWETVWKGHNLDIARNVLKNIDTVNKPSVSFEVYGVRRPLVSQHLVYSSKVTFYKDTPIFRCGDWSGSALGNIELNELFGDRVLEPQKYKITIEKL